MKIMAKNLNEIVDVDIFPIDRERGIYGITHESYENIVYSQLSGHISVSCMAHCSSENYAAVTVTCKNVNTGVDYIGIGDANANDKSIVNKRSADIQHWHPFSNAYKNAFDQAIRFCTGIPQNLSAEDYPELKESVQKTETGEDFPDVAGTAETAATAVTTPTAENVTDDEKKKLEEELSRLSLMKVTSGAHKDKTFDEVFKEKPSWFDFIATSSNPKFNDAKRYIELKKKVAAFADTQQNAAPDNPVNPDETSAGESENV